MSESDFLNERSKSELSWAKKKTFLSIYLKKLLLLLECANLAWKIHPKCEREKRTVKIRTKKIPRSCAKKSENESTFTRFTSHLIFYFANPPSFHDKKNSMSFNSVSSTPETLLPVNSGCDNGSENNSSLQSLPNFRANPLRNKHAIWQMTCLEKQKFAGKTNKKSPGFKGKTSSKQKKCKIQYCVILLFRPTFS